MRRVALVAAVRDGLILFGKRDDNNRWTLPGGNLEEGEDWEDGARRELKEEAGLEPKGELKFLSEQDRGDLLIRLYTCEVEGTPTGENDPDSECRLWAFMDHANGIPKAVAENMQGPKGEDKNIVLKEFGLGKAEDKTYYHGTQANFDQFKPTPGHNSSVIPGLVSAAGNVQRHGHFFTEDHDFASSFAGPGGRVIKAKLNLGNQLDLSGPYHTQAAAMDRLASHFAAQGLPEAHGYHHLAGSGKHKKLWQLFDGNDGAKAVSAIKAAGYNSAKIAEEGDDGNGVESHVVFSPSQIQQQMTKGTKEEFQQLIANAKTYKAKRETQIQSLVADGPAHVFNVLDPAGNPRPGAQAMVHKDTYPTSMGGGAWRVSHFTDDVPQGHNAAPDQAGALRTAHDFGADIFNPVPRELWKSEEKMGKMAIADIPKGREIGYGRNVGETRYDYNHLLPEKMKNRGLHLVVDENHDPDLGLVIRPRIKIGNPNEINDEGSLHTAIKDTGHGPGLHINTAIIRNEALRGKGLGQAMYEAAMAHAKHLGATHVKGTAHSTSASGVHRALSEKHGMDYVPEHNALAPEGAPRPGDDKFSPYTYDLKSEEKMAKTMPGPRFPRLGFADDRRETPIVSTSSELNTKVHAQAARQVNAIEANIPVAERDPDMRADTLVHFKEQAIQNNGQVSTPATGTTTQAFSKDNDLRMTPGMHPSIAEIHAHPNAPMATREHENFHLMMNRIHEKHGLEARSALSRNLVSSMPPGSQNALNDFFHARPTLKTSHPLYHEEKLASMINYLNNPGERSAFAKYKNFTPDQARGHGLAMKTGHRHLLTTAAAADEKWLKPKRFKKGEEVLEDAEEFAELKKGWGRGPRGFVSSEGVFHPVGEHEDHPDWIDRQFPTGGYDHALKHGWMAVGVAGDHNVVAHPEFFGNPEHPATKTVREIAKKHWGNTFQNYVRGHADPDLGTEQPFQDTAAFVHQGKLMPPNPFRKAEGLMKAMFSQTAYRHKQTGKVYPSGPVHDYGVAFDPQDPDPDLRQLATHYANLDEYGFHKDPVVEAGFLDHGGEFYTREEASVKAHGPERTTGGDSDVLRGSGHLDKAEEHDEVDRLLKHPDHTERRMALKLGSVQAKHLMRAMGDEDPEVQRAAMDHSGMNSDVLMHLMEMQNRERLQLRGLAHPLFTKQHLQRLYDAHGDSNKLINAITHHGDLDGPMIDKMYEDGKGSRALIANLNTEPDTIKKIIDKHWAPGHDQKGPHRYMVMEALRHPNTTPEMVEHALKNGDEGIRLAAVSSPHLPGHAADEIMNRGKLPGKDSEAYLRHALVTSAHATEKHLDMGVDDRHPRVRAGVFETQSDALQPKHVDRALARIEPILAALAMKSKAALPEHAQKLLTSKNPEMQVLGQYHDRSSKEVVKKFQAELSTWAADRLGKATKPEHFSGIIRASDGAGSSLVDHKPHLESHPAQDTHLVQAYREHILGSPKTAKKLTANKNEGITRKHLYQVPETVQSVGGQKFMVKPYHERVIKRIAAWGKNPHQGWAEMANQSLYHAAGIGDLHQKVHVSEHDMGPGHEKEPALVVAMEHNHRPICDMGHFSQGQMTVPMKDQAKKIAMMDFLTNNLDRHGGNLMMRFSDTGQPKKPTVEQNGFTWPTTPGETEKKADKLLAIDHSRSFQYQTSKALQRAPQHERNKSNSEPLEDNFGDYVKDSSINEADPLFRMGQDAYGRIYGGHDEQMRSNANYAPTFDWWGDQSENVRKAMGTQLQQIKDPEVRAHIKRNFDGRADWLDERANMGLENYGHDWYKQGVPMYRPHEMTDSERDFHGWYSQEHNNMEPSVKQMWRDRGMGHIIDKIDRGK